MTFYTHVPMSTYKDIRQFSDVNSSKEMVVEAEFELYPDNSKIFAGKGYSIAGVGSFTGTYKFTKVVHRITREGYTINATGEMQVLKNPPPPPPAPASPPPPPANTQTPKEIVHTVVSGDTLWGILKKYGKDPTKYSQLAKYNGINDPNKIYPGQKIKIPPSL